MGASSPPVESTRPARVEHGPEAPLIVVPSSAETTAPPPAGRVEAAPEPTAPPDWTELIGPHGDPWGERTVEVVDNDAPYSQAIYDAAFPKRMSLTECRAQKIEMPEADARQQGLIYPWIYSLAYGQFTASRAQVVWRVGVFACTPRLIRRAHQLVMLSEAGQPISEFDVPAGLQLYGKTDINGDGIEELIVEWHKLPTAKIYQGPRGIISLADGWREVFHGTLELDVCRQGHLFNDLVSLAFKPEADGHIRFREQKWRNRCNLSQPAAELGEWTMLEEKAYTAYFPPHQGDLTQDKSPK